MSTNREVLWEVVRPVLAWPLRSPVRLGLVGCALALVLMVVAQLSGGTSPREGTTAPGDVAAATADQALATAGAAQPTPPAPGTSQLRPEQVPGEQEVAPTTSGLVVEHDHAHDDSLGLEENWVPEEEAGDAALVTAETVADEQIVQLGVDTVSAMARPAGDVDEGAWWEKFSSYLTAHARNDYEGIDPRNVPWSSAGEGALLPDTGHAHLVRMVQVQTERGPVVVHVTREGDGWAVSRVSWDWLS